MYKKALQQRITFHSPIGTLNTQDLFSLPLAPNTNSNKTGLYDMGNAIHRQLKDLGVAQFGPGVANKEHELLTLKLEIITDVIATKEAEIAAVRGAHAKAERRQNLLKLKANNQAESESKLTDAEIDVLLKGLDE